MNNLRNYLSKAIMAVFAVVCMTILPACSNDDGEQIDVSVMKSWKAGTYVDDSMVSAFGIDNCFISIEVPDSIFERMKGKTYKDNCTVPRSDLRYLRLLHYTNDGRNRLGEMVVNKSIADEVVGIIRKLYENHYPIELMLLPDEWDADDEMQMRDNNSSSFNFRAVAGTTVLSHHSRGLAIDINTLYNPYFKKRTDGTLYVQPATATEYVDRSKDFIYKINDNDLCVRLFKEAGYEWGGDWITCKDYQHFEKIVE